MAEGEIYDAAALVISAKMAKALADRWRSRILVELSVRPLSPSQFVDLVGGELSEVSRCFRQLADWGYVEIVETRRGGHRRGGVEHVYRSIHRAHFDTSAWERLPRKKRNAFSGSILDSYLTRVRDAIDAGTLDLEPDRHISWDEISLDRVGWTQVGRWLDEIRDWVPELGLESSARLAASGEEPIPTTIGLASFRAATDVVTVGAPHRQVESVHPPDATPFAISAKTAKVVANEWRSRILMELRVRPLSPTQFVNEIGGGRRHISRCFRQLEEWDYIEVIETLSGGRRRGGKENFYRLKQRAHFDTRTWERLPRFLRDEFSVSILQSYFARAARAIEAGTLDAEVDRHLSWDAVALDRTAWSALKSRLDRVLYSLPELEQDSAERMAETDEEAIPTIVSLASFRSPKPSQLPT